MWTRLRLHQDYGDNAAAHAGQDHTDLAEAAFLREDLSGDLAPLVMRLVLSCITGQCPGLGACGNDHASC